MTDKSSKSSHRKTYNLEDNEKLRIIVAVEQIPYRLESQQQTLFEALAQRGRDNRFNGPFGAYQKKGCRDCRFQEKSNETNSHRRQERGALNSGVKLQSNEAHSGACFIT